MTEGECYRKERVYVRERKSMRNREREIEIERETLSR